jgi:two-component system, chemotaxis family, protein-glutamate methylesterase/glutaminase
MKKTSQPYHIVVVGASAGGYNALLKFVESLIPDSRTCIFIVMHLPKTNKPLSLFKSFQPKTRFACVEATDGKEIQPDRIYFAPNDKHLLFEDGHMKLGDGPAENRWRPSIDVLFRSAAVNYKTRTTGIILSGLLDDGASGMFAIRNCGGICIIQDPEEAEFNDMPLAALREVEADFILRTVEMGLKLKEIASRETEKNDVTIPLEIEKEANISQNVALGVDNLSHLKQSELACPDCGGGLWEIKENGLKRFRCHVGHSYTSETLEQKQDEQLESTLWIALRMMEDKKNLYRKMLDQSVERNTTALIASYSDRIKTIEEHIQRLKTFLFTVSDS